MSNQEKFDKMLSWDRDIFAKLVSWKALLKEGQKKLWIVGGKDQFSSESERSAFKSKLTDSITAYERELAKYNSRQSEFRNNSFYQAGQAIQEFNDKAVNYFKGLWNSLVTDKEQIGAVPLLLPLAGIAGGVITAGAIAYFVNEYYTETANSLPNIAKAIADLETINPTLANNLVNKSAELNAIAVKENASAGFGNQIGEGLKYGVFAVVGIAIAGISWNVYQESQRSKK